MQVKTDFQGTRSQMQIALELMQSLNQASGGCEQLAHTRRDPRFLLIRDALAAAKGWVITTLPKSIKKGEREKKTIVF